MPEPLFSFEPDWNAPIVERRLYLTDVQRAYNGNEQRRRLRNNPRLGVRYGVTGINAVEMSRLHALLWGGFRFSVPLWQDAQHLLAGVSSGASSLSVATSHRRFAAGGLAAIWSAPNRHEIVTIDTLDANTLNLDGVTALAWSAGAIVVPVRNGVMDPATARIITPSVGRSDVSFVCEAA